MQRTVGMIGLGIMGSALAANLLKGGFGVVGHDLAPDRTAALAALGGTVAPSGRAVAQAAEIVITCLPSDAALLEVVTGPAGVAGSGRQGLILVEASTLTLAAKEEARRALRAAGMEMLDAPLNGTAVHAVRKEVSVFASGSRRACQRCRAVFAGFARQTYYLGRFGRGTQMKFLNNLLITVHKAAAAEVLVLARKAGMDPAQVYEVLRDGAASSRMFEVKGPLMVAGRYDEPMMKLELYLKDIRNISAFAGALSCPTPMLAAASQFFTAAHARGLGRQDTAAICTVLEEMAGIGRTAARPIPAGRAGRGAKARAGSP